MTKKRKRKRKRPLTAWQEHVKDYMAKHPGLSFKEALPKAKVTYRKSSGKTSPKRSKSTKRRYRKVTSRRKRKTRRTFAIPMAILGGMGASTFVSPHPTWDSPAGALIKGNYEDAGKCALASYFGYDVSNGSWNIGKMRGWVPIIVGLLVHKFIGGWPLNLNRVLSRYRIPVRV